jgi:putative transcriptional regulator
MTLEKTTEAPAENALPDVKAMRRALGLTQQEFALRYWIPLSKLRDWEQGRTRPDALVQAYLDSIARDPEAVRRALESKSA